MLKASLDYDGEIFGKDSSQQVLENAPLTRNLSTTSGPTPHAETRRARSPSPGRTRRRDPAQNCNAPGGIRAYSQYTQEGGFVPECIRLPEIGLEMEIFNSKVRANKQTLSKQNK